MQSCKGGKNIYRGNDKGGCGNDTKRKLRVFNVCDAKPYEFNTIIRVFKKSGVRPNRPIIFVPLFVVWLATRIAGIFFSNKREWIYSCYDKLACDLVLIIGKCWEQGLDRFTHWKQYFNLQLTCLYPEGVYNRITVLCGMNFR
ncbi:MAG: hypothetical protein JXB42_01150 [Deltaproteobacteria bacterium]|nr:hypothetical protein [Deltaproteobacteria bacterium]